MSKYTISNPVFVYFTFTHIQINLYVCPLRKRGTFCVPFCRPFKDFDLLLDKINIFRIMFMFVYVLLLIQEYLVMCHILFVLSPLLMTVWSKVHVFKYLLIIYYILGNNLQKNFLLVLVKIVLNIKCLVFFRTSVNLSPF